MQIKQFYKKSKERSKHKRTLLVVLNTIHHLFSCGDYRKLTERRFQLNMYEQIKFTLLIFIKLLMFSALQKYNDSLE